MKLHLSPVCITYSILMIGSLVSALLFTYAEKRPIDTQGWGLGAFIDHLHSQGINLRVIAISKDGPLSYNAYLTENPDETWLSFQRKVKSVDHIDQWRGSVWVQCVGPDERSIQPAWEGWSRHGCRIGTFLLFGDDQIIARIQQAFL